MKQQETANADRGVLDTARALIQLFKREYGKDWKSAFLSIVRIELRSGRT